MTEAVSVIVAGVVYALLSIVFTRLVARVFALDVHGAGASTISTFPFGSVVSTSRYIQSQHEEENATKIRQGQQ